MILDILSTGLLFGCILVALFGTGFIKSLKKICRETHCGRIKYGHNHMCFKYTNKREYLSKFIIYRNVKIYYDYETSPEIVPPNIHFKYMIAKPGKKIYMFLNKQSDIVGICIDSIFYDTEIENNSKQQVEGNEHNDILKEFDKPLKLIKNRYDEYAAKKENKKKSSLCKRMKKSIVNYLISHLS